MIEIRYYAPDGTEIGLMTPEHSGVFITEGGMSGFVAESVDDTQSMAGVAGQRFSGVSTPAMSGSLELCLDPQDGQTLSTLFSFVRSSFSRTQTGTLVLEDTEDFGVLHTPVRLARNIDPPKNHPGDVSSLVISVSLVSDAGVWYKTMTSEDGQTRVEVANWGDVMIFPVITWQSAGKVTLPSGYTFPLPYYREKRRLYLDSSTSMMVTDENDIPDIDLWKLVSRNVLPEGVPPGKSAVYHIPPGASMTWNVGLEDPWR